jgi:hypothetical protein
MYNLPSVMLNHALPSIGPVGAPSKGLKVPGGPGIVEAAPVGPVGPGRFSPTPSHTKPVHSQVVSPTVNVSPISGVSGKSIAVIVLLYLTLF